MGIPNGGERVEEETYSLEEGVNRKLSEPNLRWGGEESHSTHEAQRTKIH